MYIYMSIHIHIYICIPSVQVPIQKGFWTSKRGIIMVCAKHSPTVDLDPQGTCSFVCDLWAVGPFYSVNLDASWVRAVL